MQDNQDQLTKYFLRLLSARDYSKNELTAKAKAKGFSETKINQSLNWLESRNFINEQRMAQNLVYHYGQSKGKKWLMQKLKSRKLPNEVIISALKNFEEQTPLELKNKIAQKYKIKNWQNIEPKTKQKVLAFLTSRGYQNPHSILKSWQETN